MAVRSTAPAPGDVPVPQDELPGLETPITRDWVMADREQEQELRRRTRQAFVEHGPGEDFRRTITEHLRQSRPDIDLALLPFQWDKEFVTWARYRHLTYLEALQSIDYEGIRALFASQERVHRHRAVHALDIEIKQFSLWVYRNVVLETNVQSTPSGTGSRRAGWCFRNPRRSPRHIETIAQEAGQGYIDLPGNLGPSRGTWQGGCDRENCSRAGSNGTHTL